MQLNDFKVLCKWLNEIQTIMHLTYLWINNIMLWLNDDIIRIMMLDLWFMKPCSYFGMAKHCMTIVTIPYLCVNSNSMSVPHQRHIRVMSMPHHISCWIIVGNFCTHTPLHPELCTHNHCPQYSQPLHLYVKYNKRILVNGIEILILLTFK
jgi:hypothetical protein